MLQLQYQRQVQKKIVMGVDHATLSQVLMVTCVIGYCCSMVHSIKLLLGIHPRKQSGNLDFILFMEVANSFILSFSYRTADVPIRRVLYIILSVKYI